MKVDKTITPDKVEKPKKVKGKEEAYGSIPELVKLVNSVRNVGLTVPNLMNLVKLKAELTSVLDEYNESLKALLEGKYELQPDNGGYTFHDHPKEKNIREDLRTLQETKVVLKSKLNFLTAKELGSATQNLDMAVIGEIANRLAVTE